jgi:hypothetical protein
MAAMALLATLLALVAAAATVLENTASIFTLLVAEAEAQRDIMATAVRAETAHTAPAATPVAVQTALAAAEAADRLVAVPTEVMVEAEAAASGLLVLELQLKLAVLRAPALRMGAAVLVSLQPEVQTEVLPALVVFMVVEVRAALRGLAVLVAGALAQCVLLLRAQLVNSPTQTSKVYFGDRSWISSYKNTQSWNSLFKLRTASRTSTPSWGATSVRLFLI